MYTNWYSIKREKREEKNIVKMSEEKILEMLVIQPKNIPLPLICVKFLGRHY